MATMAPEDAAPLLLSLNVHQDASVKGSSPRSRTPTLAELEVRGYVELKLVEVGRSSARLCGSQAYVDPSTPLRRGKWTKEEEIYANHLIDEFQVGERARKTDFSAVATDVLCFFTRLQKGFLNIKQFTTLRSFLAEELHCQTMRLSKKFHGKAAIGLVRWR